MARCLASRLFSLLPVLLGTLVDVETERPYELKTASCVAIYAHVGHNAQATEAVRADVMAFLTATLLK